MFAFRHRKEIATGASTGIRTILIAAIVFNALAITPAPARAEAEQASIAEPAGGKQASHSVFNFPTFTRPELRTSGQNSQESIPQPTLQQQGAVMITNGIFDVFVNNTGIAIGTYTVGTGANHPATLAEGAPQNILFGAISGKPWSSFNTIRSYTTQTDYVLGYSPSNPSSYSVINISAYSTGTTIINANEVETTWELLGMPATPDKLKIIQNIKIIGTQFSDSSVKVSILVTNQDTNSVSLGIRYFMDFMIGNDDGPTFASVNPNGPILTKETTFQLPEFESYVIRNNDSNTNPPTHFIDGTVQGSSGSENTVPGILQYVSWSLASKSAYDYTVDPNREIAGLGPDNDSAVSYLFGPDAASAYSITSQQTLFIAASLFINLPGIPNPSTTGGGSSDRCFASSYSGTQGSIGAPINTRTGGYDYIVSDISIPTSVGSLTFQREYTSLSVDSPTLLSPGWTHNHDTRLIFPGDTEGQPGMVLFKAHTANKYLFRINSNSSFSPHPGLCATLEETQDGYILKDGGQKAYTFDTSGKLISYADTEGHAWEYDYLSNGKLEYIYANGGAHYLKLQYDTQGRVYRVSDHTNRFVEYDYDTNGDLTSADDVTGETWTYEYHPTLDHFLTRVAAPGDVTVERTEFYPDGKAWKQFDGEDNLTAELIYNPDGTTTIVDALGNSMTHTYDSRGTLVANENAAGGELGKEYDYNFRPKTITDGNENITTLTWSSDGNNLTKIIDAALGETDITYGLLNNPLSIIDPMNYETKYFYEDTNFPTQPTKVEYPLSYDGGATYISTTYQYYAPNNVEGQPAGKLKLTTDALGNQTFYTYTASGQIETITSAYGTSEAQTSSNLYDNRGNLIEQTDPSGLKTRYEYDNANRLTKIIRNYLNGGIPQNYQDKWNIVTEYRYDSRGNQIAVIDTNGVITRTWYDLANRPVTVVQNLSGQTIEAFSPPLRGSGLTDENIRTDTIYDDAGNAIATIDPAEIITRTYYDEANRPKLVIQNWVGADLYGNISTAPSFNSAIPDQNVRTEYFYDLNGNLIALKDTVGVITRTYYDALNRPITVVQHLSGQDISVETPPSRGVNSNIRTDTYYDLNGNVIAVIDPKNVTTRTYYDAMNRPVAMVQHLTVRSYLDPTLPAPEECGSEENICSFTYYDQAGNVIATVDPRGMVTRTYYDSANRPVTTVRNLTGNIYTTTPPLRGSEDSIVNIRTDIEYDSLGRRDIIIDPLGRVTKYTYNDVGQLASTTINYVNGGQPQNDQNQRNIVTQYSYDALGRQAELVNTLGQVRRNVYNDLGQLLTVTQNYLPGQSQNYKNALGDRYNIVTSYTYSVEGQQIAVTDTTGSVTRTYYDDLGRPVTVVRNLVGYDLSLPTPPERSTPPNPLFNLRTDTVYLGSGNIDYMVDEVGKVTDYDHNPLGQLITVLDPLSKSTSFEYDANGARVSIIDAENVVTHYEHDPLGRLKVVIENYRPGFTPDHETNVRTEYTYDAAGNRLEILDGNSHLMTFTYNSLGYLETETDALGNGALHSYNAIGNRIQLLDANGDTTFFEYDEMNRLKLINYPGTGSDVSIFYDALGRRTSMTDGAGQTGWEYNNINLPKTISDPFSAVVAYDYDPLGNRTSLLYPDGRTVNYQYNAANRLESVSSMGIGSTEYEYDAAGRLKFVGRPNGVNSAYEYYDNGWLQEIVHSTGGDLLASYLYSYDNVGNKVQAVEFVTQAPGEFNLMIDIIGQGSVTRSDDGPYQLNDVVVLTATADPGWTFTGWSECAGTEPCSVTMTGDKTVTATFTQDEYTLDVVSENGTVTKTPEQATYHYGDVVQLEAVPNPGWEFTGWSGGASGIENPVSLTILGNTSITASYGETNPPYVYTLILQPNGADGVDAQLLSSSATTNYGSASTMGIGESNNASNRIARSLIKFDLSSLPADANIVSATLSLWTSSDLSSVDRTYNVYRLKTPFNEGQATWNRSASGVNWQSPGASGANDRESAAIGSLQILNNEALNTEKQIVLDAQKLQEFVDGTFTNNGFILAAETELNDRFDFKTSDNSNSSQRPMLVLQYTSPSTTPPPPGYLFGDGFESGDFSAWDWAETGGGDLSVTTTAAAIGTYGMQAVINDTTAIKLYDNTPAGEKHYSVRFYLDPNSVSIPTGSFNILTGTSINWAFCLYLEQIGTDYRLTTCGREDNSDWYDGKPVYIQDQWQSIEMEWKAASAVGANDGYLRLYVNDVLMDEVANLDTDTLGINDVTLGVGDIPTGTSGTIYFDGFESRTGNFIGVDPNGPQLPVPLTDLIFRDGFESADLTAWDSVNTGGGNLSVNSSAAAIGGYGLQATASGTTSMHVTDYSPLGEKQYHTRFYFNPSNFNLTPEDRVGIFSAYGGNTAFRVFLRYSGGTYWIQQDYQTDNLTYVGGVYRPLTAGWQALEFDWRAASAPGANDGSLSMSTNGVVVETLSGIDNDTYTVETVQMGLVASVDAGMSGSLYFDGFVSQRAGIIGLDPNGPTLSDPIAPPDLAFSDDFESGDLSKWSGAVTNNGNLAVSTEAADQGLYGLKVNISGTSSMYARYYPPILEDEYHARFRFHPNSLNLANGKAHYLYEGSTTSTGARLIRLEILSENSEYKLRVQVRKDDDTYINSAAYTISNDWHTIQVGWKAASADGSNDGMAELWIDDVLMESLTGVDNDLILLNEIRLGAPSGLDTGTSGAMLFDDFTAYRSVPLMESSSMPEETPTPTPLPEGEGTETPTPTPLTGEEGTPTPEPTSTETSGSLNFNVSELYKDGSVTPLTFNLQHAQTNLFAPLFPAVFNPNKVNSPSLQEGTPTATGSPTNTPTLTVSPEPTHTPTWTVTPQLTITETPIVEMFTDPTFNSTSIQPPVGPVTIFYVYDKLYRLEEANYSTGEYYHYTYDPVGNRLSEETNIGTKTYLYDDSNRLASVDGVTYTWDDNGNLLSDGTNTYAYDSANRLTSVNGTTTYQYNGLGDRISQTVNSVTTNYTLDLNTGLTQVLSDGTTEYLYGNGRIAQVNPAAEYFLGDALGSVRQMADANGEITFARGYDPYGVVTYTTGASQTEFGFTGEQYGEYGDSTQLLYLRARHYSPADGRFTSRDTWAGDYQNPLSYNKWLYAYSNPVKYIDPTGLFPSQYATFESGDGTGAFEKIDKELIHVALEAIASAYLTAYNTALWNQYILCREIKYLLPPYRISKAQIFYKIHDGKITFKKFNLDPGYFGEASGKNIIYIYKRGSVTHAETYRYLSNYMGTWPPTANDHTWIMVQEKFHRFIVHETGHAFDNAIRGKHPSKIVEIAHDNNYLPKPESPYSLGGFCGTKSDGWQWRLESQRAFANEIFADMYVSWVYNCFTGSQRTDFMNELMPMWIYGKASPER